jgi:redox-sensing transcriptional repressor
VFRVELEKERVGSLATVRRLPAYLHLLKQLNADGREFVSSTHIGRDLKLQPDQVRKDIASTGIVGKPKSGYHVPALIHAIETFLRWDNKGFEDYGLSIVSAFDSSPAKVGKVIHGRQILHMSKLRNLAERMHIHLGIIAVPAESAQEVADAMASAGIAAIWNFSPAGLNLPENVIVENIDLASSLTVLSRKLAIRLSGPAEADL